MQRIANNFHFIFGLKPQTEPFHLAWYLCLRSCIAVNRPDRVFFHYHNEPYGEWWDRIKPELELVYVEEEAYISQSDSYQRNQEGRYIDRMNLRYAHQADFIRLRALLKYGGVYADIDTLFVKPYPRGFYNYPCVMGRETAAGERETLCNALIMAEKGSSFIETWLSRMYQVFDGSWNRHSCVEPALLSKKMPQEIHVVDKEYFFHYPCTLEGLLTLLAKNDRPADNVCSIHMWSHLWWAPDRIDFLSFHGGMLTEDFIQDFDTSYNLIARQYLDRE